MTEYVSNADAAQILAENLKLRRDSEASSAKEFWLTKLSNLRRRNRTQPFELQFAKVEGKNGFYDKAEILRYVEFEKARHFDGIRFLKRRAEMMFALGLDETLTAPPGPLGRKLDFSVNLRRDESTDPHSFYAQFVSKDPLIIFKMELSQVKTLADDLYSVLMQSGMREWELDPNMKELLDVTPHRIKS